MTKEKGSERLMFEEMDDIPTRQINPEQAKVELAKRAREAQEAIKRLRDAGHVSQEVLDTEITI